MSSIFFKKGSFVRQNIFFLGVCVPYVLDATLYYVWCYIYYIMCIKLVVVGGRGDL